MKKRYSEYVNYNYSRQDEWFNPLVGWDTQLFIDPMLLKRTKIPEFVNSYSDLVNFFSNAIAKLNSKIPLKLKENMFHFEEIKEANLGYSYDSNKGRGLTGKTALSVLFNLDKFVKDGLFEINDFAEISLFDQNVNCDRITDMVLNIIKKDFLNYSLRIAKENSFPIKGFMEKTDYNFEQLNWNREMFEMPYIVNEDNVEIPVILIPKEFLSSNLYYEEDKLIDWIFHNDMAYMKEIFDYNLKNDLIANKDKIIKDIIENKRIEVLKKYNSDSSEYMPYDLDEDKEMIDKIYELAKKLYESNKHVLEDNMGDNSSMPVKDVADLLIRYLKVVITDKKGYELLKSSDNRFIAETKISKFVHVLFDARIKDAGFNVDISPEVNSGNGPVDFKISRGDDKVLIENKVSTNPKLKECIDEGKQVHVYLKQEECKDAFLVIFINKESDVDKINELNRTAEEFRNKYTIHVRDIDCIKRESASHR